MDLHTTVPPVSVIFTGCLQELGLVVYFQSDMDDLEQESINQELIEFAIQESVQDLNKSAKTSRFDWLISNFIVYLRRSGIQVLVSEIWRRLVEQTQTLNLPCF